MTETIITEVPVNQFMQLTQVLFRFSYAWHCRSKTDVFGFSIRYLDADSTTYFTKGCGVPFVDFRGVK